MLHDEQVNCQLQNATKYGNKTDKLSSKQFVASKLVKNYWNVSSFLRYISTVIKIVNIYIIISNYLEKRDYFNNSLSKLTEI